MFMTGIRMATINNLTAGPTNNQLFITGPPERYGIFFTCIGFFLSLCSRRSLSWLLTTVQNNIFILFQVGLELELTLERRGITPYRSKVSSSSRHVFLKAPLSVTAIGLDK